MKNPIVIKTHKAWQKYKKWQAKNINKIREGQEITSLGEFSEIYRESGVNLKAIKDAVRYQMSTHTWKTIGRANRRSSWARWVEPARPIRLPRRGNR